MAGAGGRAGGGADGDRRPGARPGSRHQRHHRPGGAPDRRGTGRLAGPLRGARGTAGRLAGRARRLVGALDPVRDQRPLGPARGRLQQRSRTAPGLGRVAAQRLRADAGGRVPAGATWARGRNRGDPPHRPRPGIRRRDPRHRRPHRADRDRRPARARRRPAPARRGPGRPHLPRCLLLRPGRLQGDRRGPLRPRLRNSPRHHLKGGNGGARKPRQQDPRPRHSTASKASCVWGGGPAAGAHPPRRHLLLPTALRGWPGRSRSSPSGA